MSETSPTAARPGHDLREGAAGLPLIEFRGAGKSFANGRICATRDINLTIFQGEFVMLVGPSGCGKSTLLNMVAGIFPPTEGDVRYRGDKVVGLNRRVGYMTQQDYLLPWRTVSGNIAIPLEIAGVKRSERQERVRALVQQVGLSGFEDAYPSALSGGMRKRAALARLLAYDPETLLMDEPFGALDAQLRLRLQTELRVLSKQLGKTILFVTHDVDEAVALGDRYVVFTQRPGTIRHIHRVSLPINRQIARLKLDPLYLAECQELWEFFDPTYEADESAEVRP